MWSGLKRTHHTAEHPHQCYLCSRRHHRTSSSWECTRHFHTQTALTCSNWGMAHTPSHCSQPRCLSHPDRSTSPDPAVRESKCGNSHRSIYRTDYHLWEREGVKQMHHGKAGKVLSLLITHMFPAVRLHRLEYPLDACVVQIKQPSAHHQCVFEHDKLLL